MPDQVWAIGMVRDEIDILPWILDHLLAEDIDGFYIADNNSIDGTRDLLSDYAKEYKNFHVIDDKEVGYYQSQKMTKFMVDAVDLGAEIILPFDADELFYSVDPCKTVGQALRDMPHAITIAEVWNMVPNKEEYTNPIKDIVFRESVVKSLPCAAFRYEPSTSIAMGNHDVSRSGERDYDTLKVRHFQYRSYEQWKRKVRNGKQAYEATDLPEGFGAHWRIAGSLSDEALHARWLEFISQSGLVYDPSPYSGDQIAKPD